MKACPLHVSYSTRTPLTITSVVTPISPLAARSGRANKLTPRTHPWESLGTLWAYSGLTPLCAVKPSRRAVHSTSHAAGPRLSGLDVVGVPRRSLVRARVRVGAWVKVGVRVWLWVRVRAWVRARASVRVRGRGRGRGRP